MLVVSPESSGKRAAFFEIAFAKKSGYMCIARKERTGEGKFEERFFEYPNEIDEALEFIDHYTTTSDVYFCPNLFERAHRSKETVLCCPTAWADLDTCRPEKLLVPPTVVLESSPARYQALWILEDDIPPVEAEDISRRIAYKHADEGCDKSGWDLTQLLRVPFTHNHKYSSQGVMSPIVLIKSVLRNSYGMEDFEQYPPAEGFLYMEIDYPEELPSEDSDGLLEKYKLRLHPNVWHLHGQEPKADWSRNLWQLQMMLFEGGLSREEVFVVVQDSACNKYRRDGRSDKALWKDVCRAWGKFSENQIGIVPTTTRVDALMTKDEEEWALKDVTLIEEYIDWAKSQGDAAWQYHQAGAFTILSSLLAGSVRLPTSYGVVVPNLWFMILADTTLTRKTTAMDMAIEFLMEIDPDCILATDGSIEGLFTALSTRPGRPSIFLRDEFSGLLEMITKKDYYAGMAETLTKLYDGKFQKRVLRKEIIEVRDPVLVMFAGGIKSRVLQLLNYEHVASGFLPRFIFIGAESDISRLRPLGPPTEASLGKRDELITRFRAIHARYGDATSTLTTQGKSVTTAKKWTVRMSSDAWLRYNKFEQDMLQAALQSNTADIMTPCFDRLSKSGLKTSILLAALRSEEDAVTIEEPDVVKAIYYIQQWREHALDVISNIGKTANENQIELIHKAIKKSPGLLRSQLMQNYHLMARDADVILGTLDQRNMIIRSKSGKTERLFPQEAR